MGPLLYELEIFLKDLRSKIQNELVWITKIPYIAFTILVQEEQDCGGA